LSGRGKGRPGSRSQTAQLCWRAGQEDGCPAHARRAHRGGDDRYHSLRLSKALGTTPQLWLNLQNDYDLQMATRALGKKLAKIEPVAA